MSSLKQIALLLIEFQNEWLIPSGKLHHLFENTELFLRSSRNAKDVIEIVRQAEMRIIHSGLTFTQEYEELGHVNTGLRARIKLCKTFMENTNAIEFTPPFNPRLHEFVVKGRIGSSAFSASNLDGYLRNNNIKKIFIMGYALHVCVESTLRAAHDLGYEVAIIHDASSAFNQEQTDYFLKNVVHHFGESISSKDLIQYLKTEKGVYHV